MQMKNEDSLFSDDQIILFIYSFFSYIFLGWLQLPGVAGL